MHDLNPTQPAPHDYRAYLVRLWRGDDPHTWRASAQSARTGDIARFASLEELFVFLESRTRGKNGEEGVSGEESGE